MVAVMGGNRPIGDAAFAYFWSPPHPRPAPSPRLTRSEASRPTPRSTPLHGTLGRFSRLVESRTTGRRLRRSMWGHGSEAEGTRLKALVVAAVAAAIAIGLL